MVGLVESGDIGQKSGVGTVLEVDTAIARYTDAIVEDDPHETRKEGVRTVRCHAAVNQFPACATSLRFSLRKQEGIRNHWIWHDNKGTSLCLPYTAVERTYIMQRQI